MPDSATDRVLAGAIVLPFVLAAALSPVGRTEVAFTFADPQIVESSALALVDGLVVTSNDSGDSGRVFTVDPETGNTVGTTLWAASATDVEALTAAGDSSVWVGDIGDNAERRESVLITRVPVGRGDTSVETETYELTYPDGSHDAESLLAHPADGRLYLITKEILGSTVYAVPETLSEDRPNRLERVGDVGQVLPLATDAVFFPDARHLIVRSYGFAAVYEFPSLAEVATLDLPNQELGEGIALERDGRLLLSSEGVHSDVLRIRLPKAVRDVVLRSDPAAGSTGSPSASAPEAGPGADPESPASAATDRPAWPWLVSGLIVLAIVIVLVRSLRPR